MCLSGSQSTLGHIPSRYKFSHLSKYLYNNVPAALPIIAINWIQTKCPSTVEWINKLWHIYRREYYEAIRNKLLRHITTWMDLKIILWSRKRQTWNSIWNSESIFDVKEQSKLTCIDRNYNSGYLLEGIDWEGTPGSLLGRYKHSTSPSRSLWKYTYVKFI